MDDEVELMRALCEALGEQGYDVCGLSDPTLAPEIIRRDRYEVLLSDLKMPGLGGIELLREAFEIDPNLVGVIMTGQGTIPSAVEAMKAGAFDYVLKPFRIQAVIPVLDRAIHVHRLRVENERLRQEVARLEAERLRLLEEANARLVALATTDPLTGLANRRVFDEALAREAGLVSRGGRSLSLVMFDVDRFKGFNDAFGHPAGDEVLRQVASALRACCRATDVAARIGGEEFAILLPDTDAEGARAMAERARQTVEGGPWPLRPVTMSAGVATLRPGCPAGSGTALFTAADQALYRAKKEGRNRVESAPEDITG